MPQYAAQADSNPNGELFEVSSIRHDPAAQRLESAECLPDHARDMVASFYSNGASLLLSMVTDDCVFITEAGTTCSSREEIRKALSKRKASPSMMVRETDFQLAQHVNADTIGTNATVIGSYRLYTSPRERSLYASTQLMTACFTLTEHGWKAFHIHTSNKISEAVDESVFPVAISQETYDYVREILRTGAKAGILPSRIFLESNDGSRYLSPDQILYVEAEGKHSIVHCTDTSFPANALISDVESQVPGVFLRMHRSYLVNTAHISGIRKYTLELTNGTEIPIPKRRYMEVRREIALRVAGGLRP